MMIDSKKGLKRTNQNFDLVGNTARDLFLKKQLEDEVERAKRTESDIVKNADSFYFYNFEILAGNSNNGKYLFSLSSKDGKRIVSQELDIDTEFIIDSARLDLENKKIIFKRKDGSEFNCDISELIDSFNEKINAEKTRAENAESELNNKIEQESQIREEKDVWEVGIGDHSVQSKGSGCIAGGKYSVAEGWDSKTIQKGTDPVSGQAAHAEGAQTNASGFASHSEGGRTNAEGDHAHAEGYETTALGNDSHAEGNHTVTNNFAEHAQGKFNISHADSECPEGNGTIASIGIGTAEVDPEGRFIGTKNAVEVMQNGDQYIIGIGDYNGKDVSEAKTVQKVINDTIDNLNIESETRLSKDNELQEKIAKKADITDCYELEVEDTILVINHRE